MLHVYLQSLTLCWAVPFNPSGLNYEPLIKYFSDPNWYYDPTVQELLGLYLDGTGYLCIYFYYETSIE